jgi:hypothetical protein
MTGFSRAWVVWISMSVAGSCFAAAAGETPPPAAGATEIQPAELPAKPPAPPTGFPPLIIPGAILIGIGAALATDDNSAEFPASTSTGTR